jgi:Rrf2 family protein
MNHTQLPILKFGISPPAFFPFFGIRTIRHGGYKKKATEIQWYSNATDFVLFGMKFGWRNRTPMLQLTMTGEYAVRAMIHLSSLPHGTVVSVADISRDWDVPVTFLRKIVTRLARAGMITSFRGNGGGIALARPAQNLTLLEVIEATEGTMGLNICLLSPDACHRTPWCAVHAVWCEAQHKLREVLSSRSLADLAASSRAAAKTTVSSHKQRRL